MSKGSSGDFARRSRWPKALRLYDELGLESLRRRQSTDCSNLSHHRDAFTDKRRSALIPSLPRYHGDRTAKSRGSTEPRIGGK